MTFDQLRAVQAVVLEGTFRGAARTLHKSQPAVSAMIAKLESELGFTVFSRKSYRPELSSQGRLFYDQAQISLREMTRLASLSRQLSGDEETEVRLAVNQVYPLRSILEVLRSIDTQFPATQLALNTESVGGAMDRLQRGEADIAITTEVAADARHLEAHPFAVVRVIPVARPDYGPARRGGQQSLVDVRGDVQVLVADSSVTGEKQSIDVIPDSRHWSVTSVEAKKEIIMAGMGWGGLPEYAIAKELACGALVEVQVEGFMPRQSQLFLIRRTDRETGVVASELWQALRDMNEAQTKQEN